VVYNFYFQQYTLIPPDLKESNNMNNNQTSLSVHSESYTSLESDPDVILVASTSNSITKPETILNNTLDVSQTPSPKSTSFSLNTEHSAQKPLYTKRENKKAKLMEDTMKAIKDMAKENVSPPIMDGFDMLGAYIASKLRSMTPKNQEYYEREILKVLTQPAL